MSHVEKNVHVSTFYSVGIHSSQKSLQSKSWFACIFCENGNANFKLQNMGHLVVCWKHETFCEIVCIVSTETTDASTDLIKISFMKIKIISFVFLCRSANI